MPTEDDLHGAAQRELASHALGERLDAALEAHVNRCVACGYDMHAYRHTVEVARAGEGETPATVPPVVWDRIVAQLGLAADDHAEPPVLAPERQDRSWRRGLLVAATVVAVAAAGVGGWAIGHTSSTTTVDRSSHAALVAQPGMSGSAHGTATVHRSNAGFTLSVSTQNLPAPSGYYEVWLYNPSINQMVAVGALGAGARGTFTVPAGLDLRAYHVVDVSAQKYNGDNRHQRSVLRGPLIQ